MARRPHSHPHTHPHRSEAQAPPRSGAPVLAGDGLRARGEVGTRRAFAVGTLLNVAFAASEWIVGWWANSLALIADAGHNLSDVLGLVLAWAAASMARRRPSERFTYGLRSGSILAALANAVLLLVAAGAIAWEGVRRLQVPQEAYAPAVVLMAALGVLVNTATALLLHRGQQRDLNVRGAYLHMLADAAVSGAVVIGGALIWATGIEWIDPALGLVVVAVIIVGTWGLARESLELALHAVPSTIDIAEIRRFLQGQPGVASSHDLHVWGMSTTDVALSAHLVMPAGHPGDSFIDSLGQELERRFGICHATLQIEVADTGHGCALAPDQVA